MCCAGFKMAFAVKTCNCLVLYIHTITHMRMGSHMCDCIVLYVQTLIGLKISAFTFSISFSKNLYILWLCGHYCLYSYFKVQFIHQGIFFKHKFLLLNQFLIRSSLCVKIFWWHLLVLSLKKTSQSKEGTGWLEVFLLKFSPCHIPADVCPTVHPVIHTMSKCLEQNISKTT